MKITHLLVFISFSLALFGQGSQEKHSLVEVSLVNKDINQLAAKGLEVDHGQIYPGKRLTNIFSSSEIERIKEAGFDYSIVIDDVKAYYKKYGTMDPNDQSLQSRSLNCSSGDDLYNDIVTPKNYEFGTMGGYLTYAEALIELDKMSEKYPDLVTPRLPIDDIRTHNGNNIYYLRISDNASADESEPEILYTALHHAREPNSLSQLIFFMWYVLENYDKDEEIKYLVDNTEMYFIPIVNPDGYIYNELIDPNGGGLWRKNRFVDSTGTTVGVDLNRNYGYFYAHDNFGSSPNSDSETYRGEGPFSEPETQAVRALCNAHQFQIALNYHTFGNLLIHPWGYNDQPTDEDLLFKSMANMMVESNDYRVGTGTETVGYIVNGDSDDWMYGEEGEKPKTYALTPEVGPTFWPGENNIDFLNKTTVRHNLNAAHLLLGYGLAKEVFGRELISSPQGSLFFEIERSGLKPGLMDFEVITLTEGVTLSSNSYNDIDLEASEKMEFTVEYEIDPSQLKSEALEFELRLKIGDFTRVSKVNKIYEIEKEVIVSNENALSNLDDINRNGDWGLFTNDFVSEPSSIADSPEGLYQNELDSEILFLEAINLSDALDADLKYFAKWSIEDDFDYVQVQASTDGINFSGLCGFHTEPSAPDQEIDGEVYDGEQFSWVEESVCLENFLGEASVFIRFVFHSDRFVTEDGFFLDDLRVEIANDGTTTENVLQDYVHISPNPANEVLTIRAESARYDKNLLCTIHDMSGRLLEKVMIDRPVFQIDIKDYKSGSYLVSLQNDQGVKTTTKLIKQ